MNNLRSAEFSMVVCKTSDTVSETKGNGILDRVGSQTVTVVLLSFTMSLYQLIFEMPISQMALKYGAKTPSTTIGILFFHFSSSYLIGNLWAPAMGHSRAT